MHEALKDFCNQEIGRPLFAWDMVIAFDKLYHAAAAIFNIQNKNILYEKVGGI